MVVSRRSGLVVVTLALVGLAGMGVVARADDAAESRFFDARARDAYTHRRWDDAIDGFVRAHRAAPSARLLYNIALSAELEHHESLAFAYYEEYLASADEDAARRTDATTRHAALGARLALVRIETTPPGALVYADRRDLGSLGTTPRTISLSPGAHHIELELADHEPATLDLTAAVGTITRGSVTLAPHVGRVTIIVTPPEAVVVARRGEALEVALSAGGAVSLPVGVYDVVASAAGHRDAHTEVVVTAGADERRSLALDRLPTPVGRVLVSTGEVRARVRIDGVDRAETPARMGDVAVGHHEVEVIAEGYVPWTASIDVTEDHASLVTVDLVPAR